MRRYAPPICIADMVRRYARPENRKGQERIALGPDVVYFCDSLLLFDPLNYFTHISGNNTGEELLQLN